jgi:triosephosphate isomerase
VRRPIVAGNWKMYKDRAGAAALALAVADGLAAASKITAEVVLCPPFTALATVIEALAGREWPAVGAQNAHWDREGAFTGEIAPEMLVELGCRYVIVGHSERRQHFGETDAGVARRLAGALRAGLTPIVCVGETLAQRDAGQAGEVVASQVRGSLAGLEPGRASGIILAYEPVWAIGTGRAASASDAQEAVGGARRVLEAMFGRETAAAIRLLYGGSVKPENAVEFFGQPDVDGALVGGASLSAGGFLAIAAAAGAASTGSSGRRET